MKTALSTATPTTSLPAPTVYRMLFLISLVHLLNDAMQAVIPASFPILEKSLNLSYMQVGFMSFAMSMTSSIMQPVVGFVTDKRPSPFLLPLGMAASLVGLVGLAFAPSYWLVLAAIVFIGLGSAVFHPEGSRVAYMAAGPRRGFAQSIYQVGGNTGASLAPLMTALIFVPYGQQGAIWFTFFAIAAIIVLLFVSRWYKEQLEAGAFKPKNKATSMSAAGQAALKKSVRFAIILLIFIVFARSWASAGFSNYYQFYLIKDYGISITSAQTYVFTLMIAGVIGTLFGGALADRFGKRNLILFSMLGAMPFSLFLPYASLEWALPLLFLYGMIITSSFAVTVVYAQELLPGKVGVASGLIVGLAFGMGAIGSVVLGKMADLYGLKFVMQFSSMLPLLGLLTLFLPSDRKLRELSEQ